MKLFAALSIPCTLVVQAIAPMAIDIICDAALVGAALFIMRK